MADTIMEDAGNPEAQLDVAELNNTSPAETAAGGAEQSMGEPAYGTDPTTRNVIVQCIFCYMRTLPCDRGKLCRECKNAAHPCKRAMCRNFKAGACTRRHCTRAHEGDSAVYTNIVSAGHVGKLKKNRQKQKRGKGGRK